MGGKGSGRRPADGTPVHGIAGYLNRGCKCDTCLTAWRDYMRARRGPAKLRPAKPPAEPKRDRAYYPGKVRIPRSILLTELGNQLMDATKARTARSLGDIVEKLLRKHALELQFDDGNSDKSTAA